VIFWLLIALALDKAQLVIATPGYGLPYCGLGTVDGVNQRRLLAPMAYRVLVPWIIGFVEAVVRPLRTRRLEVYEALKITLMALAFWSIEMALGIRTALIVAALLPMTFSFDYWDYAVELGALAMAVGGNMQGAVIGGVLLALSRETAPLVPVTYLLATGDANGTLVIALATGLTMLGVRLRIGYRKLYCDRFMWAGNWKEVRAIFKCTPWYTSNIAYSLLVTGLVVALVFLGRLGPTWPIPLVLLAAGWAMGVAYETRIFAGCLLWIAMGV
jgi:hypothetical protein